MYYHTRKTRRRYMSFSPPSDCHFCNPQKYSEQVFKQSTHAFVIPNRTFYDQWELRKVVDHAMIIPKRHVLSLQELNPEERMDIMDLIAEYESNGYNIYARPPKSDTRSVPHQHTHLIKTDNKPGRGLFYWVKPYILLRFR
jgi:diadenosine tetraphosphate (Ap4A) HIT family hydrolase